MEHCRERDAISNLLNISRLGNQLMQAEKPWKLVKSGDKEDKVIYIHWICSNPGKARVWLIVGRK